LSLTGIIYDHGPIDPPNPSVVKMMTKFCRLINFVLEHVIRSQIEAPQPERRSLRT